jgi:predicted nucleotidyltransferase
MIREVYDELVHALDQACRDHYGERLVSLAVFGSVGRGTPHPGSDIDILLVVRHLPAGRPDRAEEFRGVDLAMTDHLKKARDLGMHVEISPVFKTPEEVSVGSPLFLDMVDDARILHDEDSFLRSELDAFRDRLKKLGAKRIWKGSAWIWDLKPDYKTGEIFEL